MTKRRYETITLNGEYFTLDNKETETETALTRRDIYDCYERPSRYKVDIFNDWRNWFIENDGYCTVSSYNCMMFTIAGYVTDKETNERYYCYITKANNKCWKIA